MARVTYFMAFRSFDLFDCMKLQRSFMTLIGILSLRFASSNCANIPVNTPFRLQSLWRVTVNLIPLHFPTCGSTQELPTASAH
jgi:hypothetical protein